MKALFGFVSLLVVLAIVGMVAVKQMRAIGTVGASAAAAAGVAPPAASGNVREQSQQLQRKIADDTARALEQGAAARRDAAEK